VQEKVKAIVCMGTDNQKIHEAFDGVVNIIDTASAEHAVRASLNYQVLVMWFC
jgi:UDP-N-acetylmuramoylalanine--D-glutamate ligase